MHTLALFTERTVASVGQHRMIRSSRRQHNAFHKSKILADAVKIVTYDLWVTNWVIVFGLYMRVE